MKIKECLWLDNFVDAFVVPAARIEQKLIQRGVPSQRLKVLGVPIDSEFSKQKSRQEIFYRFKNRQKP